LTLSRPSLLRFIYDVKTNTIVVQNASPSQLRVIRQLIEMYDRPLDDDAVLTRRTEAIKIRYSRASEIAATLKDVYRELLSSQDKEFQSEDGKGGRGKSRLDTYYRLSGSDSSDGKQKKSSAVKIAFEGVLSIGVDEISNTLIISAQEDVWDNVERIILDLDESAKPNTVVRVRELHTMISPTVIQQALAKAISEPWPGGKPGVAQSGKSGGKENGKGKESGEKKNGNNKRGGRRSNNR